MTDLLSKDAICDVYDRSNYAETYDSHFLTSPINRGHYEFEAGVISSILNGGKVDSWGDIACGTGKHICEIQGPSHVKRWGLDQSHRMLEVAKGRQGHEVTFEHQDLLGAELPDQRFDLVTHLWYGYVHQVTLSKVLEFIERCAMLTAPDGQFLLGICDPLDVFETLKHKNDLVYGGPFNIDAVTWSYTEPWSGHTYDNCIAPHTIKIIELVSPYFEQCEIVTYPALTVDGHWNRKALLCRGRR